MTEDEALIAGFVSGALAATVFLPAGVWLTLRVSEGARERVVSKVADVVETSLANTLSNFRGDVGSLFLTAIVPALRSPEIRGTIRRDLAGPVGNALLQALSLPPVNLANIA